MGPTAIVQVGGVQLVLTSIKCMPGDLQQLRSIGIEPTEQHIIVVKAAVRWRGGYEPVMKHAILVDTPGICTANLDSLDFRHIRRPLFPLDRDIEWTSQSESGTQLL
jgi:microcystin degradation protein MlrC